jgi:hypothetical protein
MGGDVHKYRTIYCYDYRRFCLLCQTSLSAPVLVCEIRVDNDSTVSVLPHRLLKLSLATNRQSVVTSDGKPRFCFVGGALKTTILPRIQNSARPASNSTANDTTPIVAFNNDK